MPPIRHALSILMLPAALLAIDLGTPAMRSLARERAAGQQELQELRKSTLERMLADSRKRAEDMLASKKRSGNIAGMAAARTAISAFSKCSEELAKTGTFSLPEDVRREIRDLVVDCRAKQAGIEDNFTGDVGALDLRCADKLRAIAEDQGDSLSEDESLALLKQLVSGRVPATPEGEAAGKTPEGGSPAGTKDDTPTVLATHGQGDEWVTFMRWEAETQGIQVIDLQVVNCFKPRTEESSGPMGQPIKTTITPIRVLVPGKAPSYAFRLMSVPGKAPAEVMQWPGGRNAWKITLRTRPRGDPSLHAVDLQVSFPGASELRRVGEDADGGVDRAEAGAEDSDDIADEEEQDTAETETPAQPASARPRGNLNVEETTVRVSSTRSWRSSGVDVRQGDDIAVAASGTWSCGSRREHVSANGYPNDRRYADYYADPRRFPRQTIAGNYGALLMRIGPAGGPIIPVGVAFKGKMQASGRLYFDINEGHGQQFRRDNAGTLEVRRHGTAHVVEDAERGEQERRRDGNLFPAASRIVLHAVLAGDAGHAVGGRYVVQRLVRADQLRQFVGAIGRFF